MKYFSKYLPVPGEIKKGDLVMDTDGMIHEAPDSWIGQKDIIAKQFLCSRDIQVGDEAYGITADGTYKKHNLLTEQDAVKLAKTEGDFKTIGEVSPAAIWVKEGMEFEDDAIKLMYKEINGGTKACGVDWYKKLVKFDPVMAEVFSPYIEFKCPTCNTFH